MSPILRPLPEAPWGILIAVYFILAGLAAGTTLVGEWLQPDDERTAVALTWRLSWVTLLALLACGVLLIADLGQPQRFFLMLTSFKNLGSAMSIGAKLIACKSCLVLLSLYLLARRRRALAAGDLTLAPGLTSAVYTVVPILLTISSVCLAMYPAILLAHTWSAPLAASSGAALLFVSTALVMGLATATLLTRDTALLARLRRSMLHVVGAQCGLLLFAGLALHGTTPALSHALHTLLQGQAAPLFWGLAVGVGLLLPWATLWSGAQHGLLIFSGLCLLVGAASLRFLVFSVA
ncbi:MAG: NrfD/PsrC family molybdoenzyme membrane anchor subunit [Candidatus Tectimicrobiota bacterium]